MHSSTSIAIRFRKSIAVGFIRFSPSEIVGNSSGSPPASRTPRLTASASERKWRLQLTSSDQELQIPTTGRPASALREIPSACSDARWMKPEMSRPPNQRPLRSSLTLRSFPQEWEDFPVTRDLALIDRLERLYPAVVAD